MLGQNFAKMFNIEYQDKEMKRNLVWQTSWGFSTRSIGSFIMIHADNQGMVLTPKIAITQVVIVPIFFKDRIKDIQEKAEELYTTLKKAGIRVELDDRAQYSAGFRINYWEIRGILL
jgi:prolyl-tRNA synthetase